VRNATKGKYSGISFISGPVAEKSKLLSTIARYLEAGRDLDVYFLVHGDGKRIELPKGDLTTDDVLYGLRDFAVGNAAHGHIRFVYTTAGSDFAKTWRDAGAQAVLDQSSAYTPPFFLSKFIKYWVSGDSVTHAAAKAVSFSSSMTAALSKFTFEPEYVMLNGVLAPAPVFSGADIDIDGRQQVSSWTLDPIAWPKKSVSSRVYYNHAPIATDLIQKFAHLVSNQISLRPELVPNLGTLFELFRNPLWSALESAFPGREENQITVPGSDARVILGKIIPDIDKYFQILIDNLDSIDMRQGEGKMIIDIQLALDSLTYTLADSEKLKRGQPYAVRLDKRAHFEVSMRKDSIIIDRIRGFTILMKLPFLPDSVYPKKLELDTAKETLLIGAKALGGYASVVATADVRARTFKGVDWTKTILKNLRFYATGGLIRQLFKKHE
jgi:hypothetical protein